MDAGVTVLRRGEGGELEVRPFLERQTVPDRHGRAGPQRWCPSQGWLGEDPSRIYRVACFIQRPAGKFHSSYEVRANLIAAASRARSERNENDHSKATASTGNPGKASVSTGAVLAPGRYVVVPTCTGCLARDDRVRPNTAAGVTGHGHASGTADEQPTGAGADTNGGDEGPTPIEEQEREEEGGYGDDEGEGGEGGVEERPACSFDRPDLLAALGDMFDGLDADCDGVLSREEVM